jgi:hypothetical protein
MISVMENYSFALDISRFWIELDKPIYYGISFRASNNFSHILKNYQNIPPASYVAYTFRTLTSERQFFILIPTFEFEPVMPAAKSVWQNTYY